MYKVASSVILHNLTMSQKDTGPEVTNNDADASYFWLEETTFTHKTDSIGKLCDFCTMCARPI